MSDAAEGASAVLLDCPLCGTDQLCDACMEISMSITSEDRGPSAPRPVFSTNLERTFGEAHALAEGRRDDRTTEEHLLLALINDPDAAAVMRVCRVDSAALRRAVLASLPQPNVAGAANAAVLGPSAALNAIVQRAVIHVQSVGRDQVTGAHVLAACWSQVKQPSCRTRG
jgi:ATP-dependent Clp protease ATP-binding subunit ClpA